jgi:cyclohexanecarboxylate-CoA ligase
MTQSSVEKSYLGTVWSRLQAYPHEVIVVDETAGHVRGAQVVHEATVIDAFLASSGIESGAAAIVQCPNWYEFIPAYLALKRRGIVTVFVPMSYQLHELQRVVELTDPRLVIAPLTYRSRRLFEWYGDLEWSEQAPTFLAMRTVGSSERRRSPLRLINYQDVVSASSVGHLTPPWPASADEGSVVHLTGGTTGGVKGALNLGSTFDAINTSMLERYMVDQHDVLFVPSPASHGVGFCHGIRLALVAGARLVLQDGWDVERAAGIVARESCSFVAAATPFLHDVVDLAETNSSAAVDFSSLRIFLCGGAAVPRVLRERALDALPHTFTSPLWGMTECGGVTTCPLDSELSCRLDTDGLPMRSMKVRVVDAEGRTVPAGERGELQVKGPQVFQGYLGQPEATSAAFTSDGFLRSGDEAVMTVGGAVKIVGRYKELIIRGGVNIAPQEIENELLRHHAIAEVAVVGVKEPRLGERIGVAYVPCAGENDLSLEALHSWLKARGFAQFMWPEVLEALPELPRTPSGKIMKHQLVEDLGWSASTTIANND